MRLPCDKSTKNWGSGKSFDIAFGYYKPLSTHCVFEIYGGIGGSNQSHHYNGTSSAGNDRTSELSFRKLFLQPSLGLTYSGFDIALTTSISRVGFYKIDNQALEPEIEAISQNRNSILFEPALTIRGGWKYLKIQLQLIDSQNLSHSNLQFNESKMSIGLIFAFAQRFHSKVCGTQNLNKSIKAGLLSTNL